MKSLDEQSEGIDLDFPKVWSRLNPVLILGVEQMPQLTSKLTFLSNHHRSVTSDITMKLSEVAPRSPARE